MQVGLGWPDAEAGVLPFGPGSPKPTVLRLQSAYAPPLGFRLLDLLLQKQLPFLGFSLFSSSYSLSLRINLVVLASLLLD